MSKRQISIYIPHEDEDKLQAFSFAKEMTMTDLVFEFLETLVETHGENCPVPREVESLTMTPCIMDIEYEQSNRLLEICEAWEVEAPALIRYAIFDGLTKLRNTFGSLRTLPKKPENQDFKMAFSYPKLTLASIRPEYQSLWSTIQRDFSHLSLEDRDRIASLVVGTCGECKDEGPGCYCSPAYDE